jgi:uncharacterized protein (DUF58 family)
MTRSGPDPEPPLPPAATGRLRDLFSVVPTRRLGVLLLLPVPVLLLGGGSTAAAGAAALADLVLLGLAVLEAARLPSRREVRVRRTPRPILSLGARTGLEVEVRLPPGAPEGTGVRVHEDLPAEIRPAARPEAAVVPPGGTGTFRTEVLPLRRGRFPLGAIHVRLSGTLGLALRQHSFPADGAEVRVFPNLAGVSQYRLLALRGRLREAGLRHLRLRGAGTSFESLREHLPGEDFRRMDWKATARRGRLISRHYEVERSQSLVLMVEAGRLMTAEVAGGFPRLEYALNAALVLAHVAVSRDDRVGAMVFADRLQGFVPATRGHGALERVTSILAGAEGRLAEPDVEGAFRHLAARGRKRSLLVIFTEVVDPETSSALIAHVTRASGRHLPLVVTLRDRELEREARAEPATPEEAYRRAAAEELLHAREQALAMLRRRGVSVLDAEPSGLTAAVIDRYLDLKARMLI